jgi:hypothetical protein
VVRTAIWRIAIGLMATAWLGGASMAAEPAQAGTSAVAPEGAPDETSDVEPTSAVGPEEPPATEAIPPEQPGMEAVPPGQREEGQPEQAPGGTTLPDAEQVFEEGQPSTPVISSNCWFAPDRWYVNADFVVLNHDHALRDTRFAFDAALGSFFSEQNLSLGITEGARYTIGLWRCQDTFGWDHAIEASFTGLEDWHRSFAFIGVLPGTINTFQNILGLAGFGGADGAFFYYKSQFNSGGIDLRWTKRPGKDALVYDPNGFWKRQAEDGSVFTFLLGVHDAEYDERFNYSVRKNNVSPTVFGGDYANHTTNNLLGLHIGSELDYKHDLWYAGIRGGSTFCVNFAEVDANLKFVDSPATPAGSNSQNGFHTGPAAISELGFVAGWQIRPTLRLRTSYDFMWLTSVARAPDQVRLGAFQPNAINVSAGQMFTGMSLGLEFNW